MIKVTLSSIAEIIRGVSFSKEEGDTVRSEGKLPVIRAGSIQESLLLHEGQIWVPKEKISEKQKIRRNDIIICTSSGSSDLVGKCARSEVNFKGSFGAFCAGIRPNEDKVSASFLYHFLSSPSFRNWAKGSSGANIKNIRISELAEFEISLPPLPEQKRIAAILDKADAIRRKRQQAIQLADDFLRAVFLDMFGDPITNPKGWEVRPLLENITHANNGLSRRRKEPDNVGEIVLRLQDVHYDGIRLEKDLNRIRLEDSEKQRFLVKKGDILFIRVNGNPDYVGRSAVFEGFNEDVYHNDHLIRIKVGEAYHPVFLSYCFNHEAGRRIISGQVKTSAGQHTISQSGIGALEFYMPPLALQERFVRIRNEVFNLPLSSDMPSGLFSSLSQRAFSGQL